MPPCDRCQHHFLRCAGELRLLCRICMDHYKCDGEEAFNRIAESSTVFTLWVCPLCGEPFNFLILRAKVCEKL